MPVFDVRDAQKQRELLPDGVYQFKLEILPGNAGPDGWLKSAKNNMRLLMLATVNSVVAGEHAKRKVWDHISVDLVEDEDPDLPPLEKDKLDGLQTAVRLGRKKVVSIINSALGLMPNDHSEETEARREQTLENWENLNGLTYWAETKIKPGNNGYEPRVVIDYIVTPDLPDYSKATSTAVAPVQRPLKDDMSDEVPF